MEEIGEMGTGVRFVVVIMVKGDNECQVLVGKAHKVNFSFTIDMVGYADWQ
jgi:hypothetical protein